jgi:hypothetical protein
MKASCNDPDGKLRQQINALVRAGRPIVFTTATFSSSADAYMEQVLNVFLEITGQAAIADYAVFIVRELMNNAKKANTKRVYFTEKNLDINNKEEYRRGMRTFRADIPKNRQRYLALQEQRGLYIRLKLWKEGRAVKLEVSNNAVITPAEESSLRSKLDMGGRCDSLEDVLADTVDEAADEAEGAGLGIIILVLMMKKLGLRRESMWFEAGGSETKIGVEIPSK